MTSSLNTGNLSSEHFGLPLLAAPGICRAKAGEHYTLLQGRITFDCKPIDGVIDNCEDFLYVNIR